MQALGMNNQFSYLGEIKATLVVRRFLKLCLLYTTDSEGWPEAPSKLVSSTTAMTQSFMKSPEVFL